MNQEMILRKITSGLSKAVLLTALAACFSAPAAWGQNLLSNPGFESGSGGGWQWSGVFSANNSSSNAHTGSWEAKAALASSPGYTKFYQQVAVTTNSNYTASIWVQGTGTVQFDIVNSAWNSNLASVNITATSSWQQVTLPSFSSGGNTQVEFEIYDTVGGSAGTMYLDDCSLSLASGSPPGAPTILGATAGNMQVALSWSSTSGATSYNLYRGTTSGGESGTAVATGITSTSYTNTGLANGTAYYFKLAAVNASGTSGLSNEVSATPAGSGGLPANGNYTLGPACATASRMDATSAGTTNGTNIQIWQTSGLQQQTYTLTNTSGSVYKIAASYALGQVLDCNGQTTTSGTNVQLWADAGQTNQRWGLTAVSGGFTLTPQHATGLRLNVAGAATANGANVDIETANGGSGQTWAITAVAAGAPAAPTSLAASAGNTQVSLSWVASAGATSYQIYRGTASGGESATAITTGITGTSYTNTGLTNGTTYYYKAKAVNSSGTSGYSNEASATPSSGSGGPGAPDPGTAYVPAGYTLKFSDEFNGTSINTTNWSLLGPYGVTYLSGNDEIECYEPQGVLESGGFCTLQATNTSTSCGGSQTWISGAITTKATWTHGYYESRIMVPNGAGMWPAFWLTSSTEWPPEWDIMEIPDTNGTIYEYLHMPSGDTDTFVSGAEGSDNTYTPAEGAPNPYTGYVIYGLQWTATDLYYSINGVMTEHYTISGGGNDAMWVALNLAVGGTGSWPGPPNGSTPSPANMSIDYVRIYQ